MNVREFLNEKQVKFESIPHFGTYDAQHLAEELHTPGREVAKTVLLRADGGRAYAVAVLPAPAMVDIERISAALGGRNIELATESEIAEHCPDCERGTLPPFGSQYGMKTIVEKSLVADEEIVFEGNSHQEAIRMRFDDFARIEEPLVANFAALPV